jgi:hypothetical protein
MEALADISCLTELILDIYLYKNLKVDIKD